MTAPLATPTATGVITIDLGVLAANWRALSKLVAPAECGAVVKADAYGLGAQRVVPALAAAGCRTFFVATPDEAVATRALAADAIIYALDGVPDGSAQTLAACGARPVLSSLAEVQAWASFARSSPNAPAVALHVDSGLNRLGLGEDDVLALIADRNLIDGLNLALVMSHLACADDPSDIKNQQQAIAFNERRAPLPMLPASLAASDGLMLGREFHLELVRPGYALYGGQAFKGGPTPVRPVVAVSARILSVREVSVGETVGYAASWMANRASRIAVIAAGYADGVPRQLSSAPGEQRGEVAIRGVRCPIVGRVSMDLITADVTDVPGTPVAGGEWAELIGQTITLEEFGARAQTIGYEVLTRLGRRFHRIYLDGDG